MNKAEFEKIIKQPEYGFLYGNEHLARHIMFLTLGGSHAYGTNIETSDVDVRGVALNSRTDILGMTNFEQYTDNETDTTVYGFNKFVGLIMNCNPNTIEMLGLPEDKYVMLSESGRLLLENKNLFLSKKAINSFGGYANQQLRRLQTAIAQDRVPQAEKEAFALNSCERAIKELERAHCIPGDVIKLFVDKSEKEDYDTEIFADIRMKHQPLRDFKATMDTVGKVLAAYSTLGKRNTKKDEAHLDKHAMHLVRLYLMAFDILEKGEINTYREKDRDMLLQIRNGLYRNEDGTYKPEFFEMIDGYEKRLQRDAAETNLPDHPDFNVVQELVMTINQIALGV